MKPAIRVENLSKRYRLGAGRTDNNLTENLRAGAGRAWRALTGRAAAPGADFWALTDVSFEVQPGEVVGIIGRNGAGKSTLLKVLSRIVEPTGGRAEVRGRMGSLLEVGTGFHPELTGRENVFLNGSILGMTRREIARKFDEIVAFSEIEAFLDTPVKRYSSGMFVRLAFAVAAHLEPEILVVDEVLAVGDAAFQAKCLGKMSEIARGGRTIIFVSHQLATVSNLCRTAVVLRQGRCADIGPANEVIERYVLAARTGAKAGFDRPSWAAPCVTAARTVGAGGEARSDYLMGDDVVVEMDVVAPPGRRVGSPVMGVVLSHPTFGTLGGVNTRMTNYAAPPLGPGEAMTYRCRLVGLPLLHGVYTADLWFGDGPADLDVVNAGVTFQVHGADVYGTGKLPFQQMGVICLRPAWDHTPARPGGG